MNGLALPIWLEVLLLAVVQGLTEFLPISSSGHLVLTQAVLGLQAPGIVLELVLHLGTLLAVVLYYRRDLGSLLAGLLRLVRGRRGREEDQAGRLAVLLIVGTIPAVIGALLFGDRVEAAFEDPRLTCGLLLVTGLLLLSTLLVSRGIRMPDAIDALIVGLFQMASLFPGISRSGSTMSAGLFRRLRPEEAARFSFLLSIPAILGAVLLKAKVIVEGVTGHNGWFLFEGFVVSFLLGYASIAVLLRVIRRGRFGFFGIYCLVVGAFGIVLLSAR